VGLRLLILSWWTPKYLIRKELENISDRTTTTLETLISKYAIKEIDNTNPKQQPPTSIQVQRATMAQTQAKLVETLEAAVGHEEAVKLGREALFSVGQGLGKLTRSKLGVSGNPKDLTKAAKILYRVLGIDFHIEWLDNSSARARVIVDSCALAGQYSKLTCEVLSATDEGVINGLQPNVTMKFKEFMTSGCKNCRADIYFNEKETKE
jgi:hypothetical protein